MGGVQRYTQDGSTGASDGESRFSDQWGAVSDGSGEAATHTHTHTPPTRPQAILPVVDRLQLTQEKGMQQLQPTGMDGIQMFYWWIWLHRNTTDWTEASPNGFKHTEKRQKF